ncbi:transcription initiation factor TFIID subunit 11 [Dermatophagoides farinae]|uniref:Transcription initiation factor TFIID subunit 11 n=1 Tax=Dermatophagoides farinae TaxID=6954 RepID=A0A9D4NZ51_DERFA|nr:transcription initiation factor TFIID subunit 11-like [Dermatophagoides farinae]KAH7640922.1 transcription initiation factor tfiid subunit 11 [Dermatophagoides farinae]
MDEMHTTAPMASMTWNDKMMILLENFNHEQFSRYEMCRRSKFSKSVMKKFIRSITDVMINDKTAIALAGIAKVYVGELIETALDYQQKIGENGPLTPKHLRESFRQLNRNNQRRVSCFFHHV